MQTQLTPQCTKTKDALYRFTGRLLTEIQSRRRPIRHSFQLPHRQACLTRRAKIAAMRETELNDWLNDEEAFTAAMHQPVA